MRGWPPLESALLLLAFGLALIPLYGFTIGKDPVQPISTHQERPAEESSLTLVFLTLRFAHPPESFSVHHLDKTIWSSENENGGNEFYSDTDLDLTEDGIDLRLSVTWPEGTPSTAAELTLEPDLLERRSVTLWGSEDLQSVATFQW